jgi:hypothetical protein
MGKKSLARNDAGSTMVELLVATAVFMTGMVALLGGLMTLTTHGQVADERARATNFSRSTFEDLRGRSINQILAYNIPVDDPQTGTVQIPGIGTATASAFAVIPDGQGGFDGFELGVDDPAGVNVGNLPNPIEVRLVLTPVRANGEGQYSTMNFYSTTMLSW